MVQAILKIACQKADDTITLPPQLRKALVLLLAAAPKGSELVKEVVAALEQGLAEACSLSALPELILSLLQLPDVCLVSHLCVSAKVLDEQYCYQSAGAHTTEDVELQNACDRCAFVWYQHATKQHVESQKVSMIAEG